MSLKEDCCIACGYSRIGTPDAEVCSECGLKYGSVRSVNKAFLRLGYKQFLPFLWAKLLRWPMPRKTSLRELLQLIRYSLALLMAFGAILILYVLNVIGAYATLDVFWIEYYRDSLLTSEGREQTLIFLRDRDSFIRSISIFIYYFLQSIFFMSFCFVWLGYTRGYLVLLWSCSAGIWLFLVFNVLLELTILSQDLTFNSMSLGTTDALCPWPGRIGPALILVAQICAALQVSKGLRNSQWAWGSAAATSILALIITSLIQGVMIDDWLPFIELVYADKAP